MNPTQPQLSQPTQPQQTQIGVPLTPAPEQDVYRDPYLDAQTNLNNQNPSVDTVTRDSVIFLVSVLVVSVIIYLIIRVV